MPSIDKGVNNDSLLYILQRIKANFARITHSHAASDINSGTLDAARIPDLNASKITAGTLGTDRIPNLNASKINAGTLDAARIPDLNASKITAGTIATARLPVMTGAASGADGVSGMVPAPTSSDTVKLLFGDGAWRNLYLNVLPYATGFNLSIEKDTGGSSANGFPPITQTNLPGATTSAYGMMSPSDKTKLDALPDNATLSSTYALKSDITSMYRHKGSVANDAALAALTGMTAGDVYNVTATGMNYVYVDSTTGWDALGTLYSPEWLSNSEIDAVFTSAGLTETV